MYILEPTVLDHSCWKIIVSANEGANGDYNCHLTICWYMDIRGMFYPLVRREPRTYRNPYYMRYLITSYKWGVRELPLVSQPHDSEDSILRGLPGTGSCLQKRMVYWKQLDRWWTKNKSEMLTIEERRTVAQTLQWNSHTHDTCS